MSGSDLSSGAAALARLRDNAFHVLELPVECSRIDVERQGQKLLAMLELGLSAAANYPTPVGPAVRDADKVRLAMASLRDPDKRLEEELWARLAARPPEPPASDDDDLGLDDVPRAPRADGPWTGAFAAFGWSTR